MLRELYPVISTEDTATVSVMNSVDKRREDGNLFLHQRNTDG